MEFNSSLAISMSLVLVLFNNFLIHNISSKKAFDATHFPSIFLFSINRQTLFPS